MYLALVFGLLASPVVPESKTFKDWIVVCDNGLTCTATGEAFDSQGQGLTVRLTRGPLADDAPRVQFRMNYAVPSGAIIQHRGFDLANVDERGVVSARDVSAFIALSRRMDSVTVFGSDDKMSGEVSLAGSTAAMLYMDEQQARVGTTSALISRGRKKSVPPPPAIRVINAPALSDVPPASWEVGDGGIDFSCRPDLSRNTDPLVKTYRLDARFTLILAAQVCSAGAYNMDHSVSVIDNEGNPVPSQMEVPSAMDGEGGLHAATNAYFDEKTGRLHSSILCQGSGNCGVSRSFVWDGEMFRLVHEEILGTGRGPMDPMTTWRSDVVRLHNAASTAAARAAPQPAATPSASSRMNGDVFSDCTGCPSMVVVPAGSFTMGSPSTETGRLEREGPQRTVTIASSFAVGRYEVTWAEWDACAADGGCNAAGPDGTGGDESWGKGKRPVINVDWNDAQAYVSWLSRKSGQRYRLLSEAEWEYAARAGNQSRWNFGEDETRLVSFGWYSSNSSNQTQPVGTKTANAFGLYDMHGNVWEWTQDCWNDSYRDAPKNGSAWTSGDCSRRVLRGGSWFNDPVLLRSAIRGRSGTSSRYNLIGFRVASTLQ